MNTATNALLAPLTSLAVGGNAEHLSEPVNNQEIIEATQNSNQLWLLGYGTNSLISDSGLSGKTLRIVNGTITSHDMTLIADAGVWWDDVVAYAIDKSLWGIECMSAIPGGVGGAVVGNIAAYGQAINDTLQWVEVFDTKDNKTKKMTAPELEFSYRHSVLQNDSHRSLIVLRAAFRLSKSPTNEISYQRLLDAANRNELSLDTLDGRRQATLIARKQAGSLWDYREESHESNNAGSFFRNPLVNQSQVESLIAHDESGTTAEQIKKMNQIHGGDSLRVSAAHVLLAAGFKRGQTWGSVRLHPDHVLKLETLSGATATEVYEVVTEIIMAVKEKLDIELIPEPRFMGF